MADPLLAADVANSIPVKAPVAAPQPEESIPYFLAFSGVDITPRGGVFGFAGATIAPWGGLDTSGFRIWVHAGGGTYKYFPEPGTTIKGTDVTGDFLVGYGFEGNNYSIDLFVGVNAWNHQLSEFDPENSVQGTAVGAEVRGELWANPTPQTLLAGEAQYSTAFGTYWAKAKVGYDISNGQEFFIGPELIADGDQRFDRWRIGAHVTAAKINKLIVEVSGGYLHSSDLGNGAYGLLQLSTQF